MQLLDDLKYNRRYGNFKTASTRLHCRVPAEEEAMDTEQRGARFNLSCEGKNVN
jgi:hypothetical protein